MTADRYERDEWDDMEPEPTELDGRAQQPYVHPRGLQAPEKASAKATGTGT